MAAAVESAPTVSSFGGLSLVKKDGTTSKPFPLVERRYLFGRQEHCDIRINLIDVSREHAEIIVDDKDQVCIRNVSKAALIFINDCEVSAQEKRPLSDGDVIQIARRQFIYHGEFSHLGPKSSAKKGATPGPSRTPLAKVNAAPASGAEPAPTPAPAPRPANFCSTPTRRVDTTALLKTSPAAALTPAGQKAASAEKKSSEKNPTTPRAETPASGGKSPELRKSLGAASPASVAKGSATKTRDVTSKSEGLEALAAYGEESLEESFKDDNVSLNTSHSGSTPDESANKPTPTSSKGGSRRDSTGSNKSKDSPYAGSAGRKTAATLMASATKEIGKAEMAELLEPKVFVFSAPEMPQEGFGTPTKKTPPSGKKARTCVLPVITPSKGLLKTPGSQYKRKSVCFVDKRNELAHCLSRNDDPDFQAGIVRSSSQSFSEDEEEEEEAAPAPAPTATHKRTPSKASRSPDVRGGKRRRVEATTYAGVTIAKHSSGVAYVELRDDAPGAQDIEDYFIEAANRLFADILAGAASTPEKYMQQGRWVSHTPGAFQSSKAAKGGASASKRASTGADRAWAEEAFAEVAPKTGKKVAAHVEEWAEGVARSVLATPTPTEKEVRAVQEQVVAASRYLFHSPEGKTTPQQVEVIGTILHNAVASVTSTLPACDVAQSSASKVKQMFTRTASTSSTRATPGSSKRSSLAPSVGSRKSLGEEESTSSKGFAFMAPTAASAAKSRRSSAGSSAAYAQELYAQVAPKTGEKKAARDSVGSARSAATPAMEVEEMEEPAPKSSGKKRLSVGSVKSAKSPAKEAVEEEDDAEFANELFSAVAPKTGEKAARRSSTGSAMSTDDDPMDLDDEEEAPAASTRNSVGSVKSVGCVKSRRSSAGRAATPDALQGDWEVVVEEEAVPSRRNSAGSTKSVRKSVGGTPAKEEEEAAAPQSSGKKRLSVGSVKSAKSPAKEAVEEDEDAEFANELFSAVAPKTGEKKTRRSSTGSLKAKTPVKEAEEEEEAPAPKSSGKKRLSVGSAKAQTPAKEAEEDDMDAEFANEMFAAVAPKTGEKKASRRSSTGSAKSAKTPAKEDEEEDEEEESPAPKSSGKKRLSVGSSKAQTPAKEAMDEDEEEAPAPESSGKKRLSVGSSKGAATPAKEAEEEAPAPKSSGKKRLSVGSPKAQTPAKEAVEEDGDAEYAAELFAAVAPKTADKKASRRSSTGSLKAKTPVKEAEEEEEEAPVPKSSGKKRLSVGSTKSAKSPAKEAVEEDDDAEFANELFSAVAPKTGEKKAARRSSIGSLKAKTPAKEAMEEEEEAPAPKSSGKKRLSVGSTKSAKTPAKEPVEDDGEEEFANELFSAVVPKTGEKKARRSSTGSLKAKTPVKEAEKEEEAPAPKSSGKKRLSVGSAKAQTPAKEAVEDDMDAEFANELFSAVAPKTGEKKASRRSSTGSTKAQTPAKEPEEEAPVPKSSGKKKAPTPAKSPVKEAMEEEEAPAPKSSGKKKAPTPVKEAMEEDEEEEVPAPKSSGKKKAPTPAKEAAAESPAPAPKRSVSKRAPRVPPSEGDAEYAQELYSALAPKSAEKKRAPAPTPPVEDAPTVPPKRTSSRKSVLPPMVLDDDEVPAAVAAPPPRRGRKSVAPVMPPAEEEEEGPKGPKGKRVAQAEPTAEEDDEVAAAAARRAAKRGRGSLAAKSPHVSIGATTEYFITPKKVAVDEEEEEEVPKPKARGKAAAKKSAPKKAAAKKAAPKEEPEVEEEAPKPKGKGSRAAKAAPAEPVEEPAPKAKAAPKASRGKRAAPANEAVVEEEPEEEAPKPKAARGRKSVAPVEEAPEPAPKRGRAAKAAPVEEEEVEAPKARGRGKKAVAPVEEAPEEAPEPKATKGKKAAAKAEPEPEPEAPKARAGRGKKAAEPVEEAPPAKEAPKAKASKAKKAAPEPKASAPKKTTKRAAAAPAEEPAPKRATRSRK